MFSSATKTTKNVNAVQLKTANNTFFRKADEQSFFNSKENHSFFGKPVQAKLTVSAPDDPHEKETDVGSNKVLQRVPSDTKQQKQTSHPTNDDWRSAIVDFDESTFLTFSHNVIIPKTGALDLQNQNIVNKEAFLLGLVIAEAERRGKKSLIKGMVSQLNIEQSMQLIKVLGTMGTSEVVEFADQLSWLKNELDLTIDRGIKEIQQQLEGLRQQKLQIMKQLQEIKITIEEAKPKIYQLLAELDMKQFIGDTKTKLDGATSEQIIAIYRKLLKMSSDRLSNLELKKGSPIKMAGGLAVGAVVAGGGPENPAADTAAIALIGAAAILSVFGAAYSEWRLKNSNLPEEQTADFQEDLARIFPKKPPVVDPAPPVEPNPDPPIDAVVPVPVKPKPKQRPKCKFGEIYDPTAPSGLQMADPIEIIWYKPLLKYENPIVIGGNNYFMTAKKALPPPLQFIEIGIDAMFLPFVGKSMLIFHQRDRGQQGKFKRRLRAAGYNWRTFGGNPVSPDHVLDLMWNGPDEFENLWPLESSYNSAAGKRQNLDQMLYFRPDPNRPCAVNMRIEDARSIYSDMSMRKYLIKSITTV